MEELFSLWLSLFSPDVATDVPKIWDSTPGGWEIYMERSETPGCFLWKSAAEGGFLRLQISRPDNMLFIYFGSGLMTVEEATRYPLDMDLHDTPVWGMSATGFTMDTIPTLGTALYDADAATFLEEMAGSRTLSLRSGAVLLDTIALLDVDIAIKALESCQGVLDRDRGYTIERFRSIPL